MVAFAAAAQQLVATVATCYGINLRSSNATLRVIVSGAAFRHYHFCARGTVSCTAAQWRL